MTTPRYFCKVSRLHEPEECGHKSCAEARTVLPNGIEKFVPRCAVCTTEVPAARARGHNRETCSTICGRVWKEYKRYNLTQRACPNCMHPHTPEERKDFIAWRRSGRNPNTHRGRPPVKRVETLRLALCEAIGALQTLQPDGADDEMVKRFQKLVDTKDGKQDTLIASVTETSQEKSHGCSI